MSSDRCSPLKLPIQIETSCAASKDHCKCDADNCQTNCQISTDTLHLQGAYQNTCCDTLEQECGLTIAYLSNVRNNNCDPDVKVITHLILYHMLVIYVLYPFLEKHIKLLLLLI